MGTKELSATAHSLAWGRSTNPELSLDTYAHLWTTENGQAFGEGFAANVSPCNGLLCCLRGRYFIDALLKFESKNQKFSLINVGSGLTSYPFILSSNVCSYEIDQDHVLAFRKKKISELTDQGLLPKRSIEFCPMDLGDESSPKNIEMILAKQSEPSFVLFEGIFTYLSISRCKELVEVCSSSLLPGSRMVIHIFFSEFGNSPMMKKIQMYFQKEMGLPPSRITCFPRDTFQEIEEFRLVEHAGYLDLCDRFVPNQTVDKDSLIDERFLLFEKTA